MQPPPEEIRDFHQAFMDDVNTGGMERFKQKLIIGFLKNRSRKDASKMFPNLKVSTSTIQNGKITSLKRR